MREWDVAVVGAGNAGLCAAVAAAEAGARVVLLEKAPRAARGGNSRFTAGAMRFAYGGLEDIVGLVPDLPGEQRAKAEFGSYPREAFLADLWKTTDYRADPGLARRLVDGSLETLVWLRSLGVRFVPLFGTQAFEVAGRFRFWGGLVLGAVGGGEGLVDALYAAAERRGVSVRYGCWARSLLSDGGGVQGVRVLADHDLFDLEAGAVVLACGGFEANAEMRARYLGPGWDLAKVRGTRHNTGDGLRMALEIGAMPFGNWSGCHSVAWDANAPDFGDLRVGDAFQRHSYPFGIVVNANGRRFVDEGADFRNYTYAKYGGRILEQPGQVAWQIFDGKVLHLLRAEYRAPGMTRIVAATLEELAGKLDGVEAAALIETIRSFNGAVDTRTPFDPNLLDGKAAAVDPPKSNWATTIDEPPFEAYPVTCGITFTFGGVRVGADGAVRDVVDRPIRGLYAAGELVGGLFYGNYPGGSGLTAGSVFGRTAGTEAAAEALRNG